MMNFLDILLLSIALAMDCFTVSIISGVILKEKRWGVITRMSFFFGLFQAAMPFIGWLGTKHFAQYIEAFDHWIAFGLLAFLGIRMIKESFEDNEDKHFNPTKIKTQLVLAVATSIDALAVGISFACTGYTSIGELCFPLWAIDIVSFLFGVIGNLLGIRFGSSIRKRLKPDLFGGIILIIIGVKILLSHLLGYH